ncbi:MAG: IclR family transcriptional regulator, regulon repressor [Candidatus Binatota bacterium]|nr:IclR family transcriptional regulator, regulon repressor [Candidatus Binatota bacterium]
MRREKTNYVIQSVAHALDVLEQFRGDVDELGVTELSKRLKLHKNNVFRLLATLESRGYIEQNKATENYRLGIRCLQLGQTYIQQMGLLRQAEPILQKVAQKTRENTSVAVMRRAAAVPVRVVESNLPVRITANVGEGLPLHSTALGKVFLAFESEEDSKAMLGMSLDRFTDKTITDIGALLEHLKQVAEKGYAVDGGEFLVDVRGIAAPIRDYTRNVVGAFGVSGPAYRLDAERIEREVAPMVLQAGKELSSRLGYHE